MPWATNGSLLAAIAGEYGSYAGNKARWKWALAWLSFRCSFGAGDFSDILPADGDTCCVCWYAGEKTAMRFDCTGIPQPWRGSCCCNGLLPDAAWGRRSGAVRLRVTRTPVLLLYLLAWMQTESRERQKIERAAKFRQPER